MGGRGRPRKRKAHETPAPSSDVRKSRGHIFILSCTKAYPCIVPSKVSSLYAMCSVCECDFLISHGGFNDVSRHVKSMRHITKGQSLDNCSKMTSFFSKSENCSGRWNDSCLSWVELRDRPWREKNTDKCWKIQTNVTNTTEKWIWGWQVCIMLLYIASSQMI